MKTLRKTIRRLILENQGHYEKLAVLLSSAEVASVSQAISLGESLGYLTVNEEAPSPTGIRVYYDLTLTDDFFNSARPYLAQMEADLLDDCEIIDAQCRVRFVASNR